MRRTERHLINVILIASALTATASAHGVGHAEGAAQRRSRRAQPFVDRRLHLRRDPG